MSLAEMTIPYPLILEKPPAEPSSLSFAMPFEELSIVRDGQWHAGYLDGAASITYDRDSDEWFVDGITISACNRKTGADAKRKTLSVDPIRDRDLYDIIYDRFIDKYSACVDERVRDLMAEDYRERMKDAY